MQFFLFRVGTSLYGHCHPVLDSTDETDACPQAAYPGDVIGINNPGHFAIGDTIFTGSTKVRFPGIPSFSPECFAYMRNPNPSKYKNYRKGLDQVKS